eukprot:5235635-Pleurochrysis_carterae.AAC.1
MSRLSKVASNTMRVHPTRCECIQHDASAKRYWKRRAHDGCESARARGEKASACRKSAAWPSSARRQRSAVGGSEAPRAHLGKPTSQGMEGDEALDGCITESPCNEFDDFGRVRTREMQEIRHDMEDKMEDKMVMHYLRLRKLYEMFMACYIASNEMRRMKREQTGGIKVTQMHSEEQQGSHRNSSG